jgi:hypothetical protein
VCVSFSFYYLFSFYDRKDKEIKKKSFNCIWPTILENSLSIYFRFEILLHGFYNKFIKLQKILTCISKISKQQVIYIGL